MVFATTNGLYHGASRARARKTRRALTADSGSLADGRCSKQDMGTDVVPTPSKPKNQPAGEGEEVNYFQCARFLLFQLQLRLALATKEENDLSD